MRHRKEPLNSFREQTTAVENVPLYQRNLKEIQIQSLDLETIKHLFFQFQAEFGSRDNLNIEALFPTFTPVNFKNAAQIMPSAEWFPDQNFLTSIHGLHSHQRRVILASILGNLVNLTQKELLQVQVACSVNDIIRHDDRNLPISANHPQESAEWFKNNIHLFQARGIELTPEDIEVIYFLISTHELRYSEIEPNTIEHIGANLIKTHKDAIALDRFRLPKKKWWPKSEYLNLNESKQLLKIVGLFLLETEQLFHENPKNSNYQEILYTVGQTFGFFLPSDMGSISLPNIEIENNTQDPWEKWIEQVKKTTPLGHLYTENSELKQMRTQGKQSLVHITGALPQLQESGLIYPSAGGCMGASVYCAPLNQDGSIHNLTQFMLERQMPATNRAQHTLDALILEFDAVEQTKTEKLNYMTFGSVQWQSFQQTLKQGIIPATALETISNIVLEQVGPEVLSLLSAAQNIVDKQDLISQTEAEAFIENFLSIFDKFDFLGYIYFELFTQFVSMHQQDEKSIALAEKGELNTIPYHEIAFQLVPSFEKKFRLRSFNPDLNTVEEALKNHSSLSENFSANYFRMFMAKGMSSLLLSALKPNQNITVPNNLINFGTQNPDFAGNLIHRAIRHDPTWRPFHFIYEQQRAQIFWDMWQKNDTLFVSHGIIPKGEIGFNPMNSIKPTIYKGRITPDFFIEKEESIENLAIADQILPFNKSLLRHHS